MKDQNQNRKIKQLVRAALLTATVTVSTLAIQIPTPVTGGYVHLGDCFCLLCVWLLPPFWGIAAAGIGTMLADLLSGYVFYAPASLVIKGIFALLAWLIFKAFKTFTGRNEWTILSCAVSATVAEVWMILGYFLFNAWVRGHGLAALSSVPANLIQAAVGVAGSMAIWLALQQKKSQSGDSL